MDECSLLGPKLKNEFFCAVDIFEALDWDEFLALPEADKDLVKLLLSLAHVDLCDKSTGKELLWQIFPQQSKTRKAIKKLLEYRAEKPVDPPNPY